MYVFSLGCPSNRIGAYIAYPYNNKNYHRIRKSFFQSFWNTLPQNLNKLYIYWENWQRNCTKRRQIYLRLLRYWLTTPLACKPLPSPLYNNNVNCIVGRCAIFIIYLAFRIEFRCNKLTRHGKNVSTRSAAGAISIIPFGVINNNPNTWVTRPNFTRFENLSRSAHKAKGICWTFSTRHHVVLYQSRMMMSDVFSVFGAAQCPHEGPAINKTSCLMLMC